MAKMVGLSRNLKLAWLNQAVELVSSNLTEYEIKEKLNEYLGFEIGSPTNIRKTREILMYIWYYENEYTEKIKPIAVDLIKKYPDYALEIHWCMMLAAYPVFMDMCKLIGKMSEFQDEINLIQLKQKLFDEWGERSTLYHSIDKLVSTLKSFGVLTCDKPGKYHINKHKVTKDEVSSFVVYTMMNVDDSSYYSFKEINGSTYLFPFEYHISKEILLNDERFVMNNFGGELSITLNN